MLKFPSTVLQRRIFPYISVCPWVMVSRLPSLLRLALTSICASGVGRQNGIQQLRVTVEELLRSHLNTLGVALSNERDRCGEDLLQRDGNEAAGYVEPLLEVLGDLVLGRLTGLVGDGDLESVDRVELLRGAGNGDLSGVRREDATER